MLCDRATVSTGEYVYDFDVNTVRRRNVPVPTFVRFRPSPVRTTPSAAGTTLQTRENNIQKPRSVITTIRTSRTNDTRRNDDLLITRRVDNVRQLSSISYRWRVRLRQSHRDFCFVSTTNGIFSPEIHVRIATTVDRVVDLFTLLGNVTARHCSNNRSDNLVARNAMSYGRSLSDERFVSCVRID